MGSYSRDEQKDLEVTAESLTIDRVSEEALRGYSQILAEINRVQIINEYLSNDKSGGLRYDIRGLQRRLEGGEDRRVTRMLAKKTLRGKWWHSGDQEGSPKDTPETSDDEYDDEDTLENNNYKKQ